MASFGSSHPLTPPPSPPTTEYGSIFINLPPLQRLTYTSMHTELQFLVRCAYIETQQITAKEHKQAQASDLLLVMRKLCVDHKLLNPDIYPYPINALFDSITIHDASPNFVSEKSLCNFHRKFCAKCRGEEDVLVTSCFHYICIDCMSYLWMHNGGPTKKLCCYICKNDMEIKDIWLTYDARSKVDIMVELLKEEDSSNKVIVFCEFVETLVRLEFALRSNNMKGWCYFHNMNGTFNTHSIHQFQNSDDANIILFGLKLLNDLEGFDLSCVSKIYMMNGCPETTEQEVVSLVTKQKKQVKFVRILARDTIECRLIEVQKTGFSNSISIGVQNIQL